ncbi:MULTISPECIES: hypothetical protein [unclassified Micromonospora]|uniref:hypothetical protein n=1 Tax=unclassified Micromonospora TaxID=2617518 RepID=UPI003A84983D
MRIWRPRNRRGWLLLTAALLIPGSLVVADRIAAGVVGGRLADAAGGDELRPAGRATPSGTDKCGESA